jgi:hypothetical protein
MAVPISNVTRRQVYAPSGAGGAGPYAFTFEILANTDIAVYKDDVLLTLTTHYTVTINANGTGSVTITATGLALAPTSPSQYAIVGNRTISRSTDFTTGGDFFANVLNDELDQQTIFAQQNAEGLDRALQAPQTDPTSINMTLPRKVLRAGKLLAFNISTGNPEAGPDISNFSGIYQGAYASAPATRFDTTALQAGDLYFDTTSDSMRVYTGGAWQEIAPEMAIGHQAYTATAGQTSFAVTDGYNVNSVYVYLNGVLLDAADYTATNGTSIVLASGATLNDTVRVVTYFNPVDTISIRNAAAASAAAAASSAFSAGVHANNALNSATSASGSATTAQSWADASAGSAITSENYAVAAGTSASSASASAASAASSYDSFDDRYLGSKSSDPTVDNDGAALLDGALYWDTTNNILKVYDQGATTWRRTTPTSSDQANINTVTGIAANVTTVAGIAGNVTTVAGISANVTSVAGNSANINTVATDIANVNAVGGNISNVNSVAGNATNINAVVSNASNINTVAGINGNVTTVAGISANVTTVAGNSSNVTTVAGISANVTTVAGSIADVNTVAANIGVVQTANANAVAAAASAAAAATSEANTLTYRNQTQNLADLSIVQLANALASAVVVNAADYGAIVISGAVFAIENIPATRVDFARDTGSIDLGSL